MKKTLFALFMILLLSVPVFGTESIDETRIPIEDTMFDSMGWLAIRADTPGRFEGTLYIELVSDATGECITNTLTSSELYIGGKWLGVGSYTVKDVYAFNRDFYTVTASVSTVEISSETDAELLLTVTEDPSVGDEWAAAMATRPTEVTDPEETDTTASTATPSESVTAAAPSESTLATSETAETSTPADRSGMKKEIWSIASSVLFMGIAILAVYLIQKKHHEFDV